jgi:hypothetical protein
MKDFNIEPPAYLYEKIMKRIHKEERLLVLRRVILFSITLTGSVVAFFPSFNMLISDFNQSGFLHFLSLTFSDFSIVATYWKSFTIILLESLPALSLALFLAVLLTFLQSIKSLARDVKTIIKATA